MAKYLSMLAIIPLLAYFQFTCAQYDPYWRENRTGIVHLFEWKFKDIAEECENFLAPNGYAGVQTSPVNEYLDSAGVNWWERYQPISYKLVTRSGNEEDLLDMTTRCNRVGVRIYVDVVINHMAAPGPNVRGTDATSADPLALDFPGIPFTKQHFHHPSCTIQDYNDPIQVRNCNLGDLPDLDQSIEYVREKIIDFLDHLLSLGVAGFRVDASKHMWPQDLKIIYDKIQNLNTSFGFPENSKPFIYQEVIELGQEKVSKYEYTDLGVITEFKACSDLGMVFRHEKPTSELKNWGQELGYLPTDLSLVFVDNHDNQRGHGAGGDMILTYKVPKMYKMAQAFLLSQPFGVPRVMSSFNFSNSDQGPPTDSYKQIISPEFTPDQQCSNGWVCEHRWNAIVNMIHFRNTVRGTDRTRWTEYQSEQISYCRGDKGFVAINNSDKDFKELVFACVPPGDYCDIISGSKSTESSTCTGLMIHVDDDQNAEIEILADASEGVIAIDIGSKL